MACQPHILIFTNDTRCSFDTAYCTIYEKDPCEGVFGAADVVADDLPGLTKAIIERWGEKN